MPMMNDEFTLKRGEWESVLASISDLNKRLTALEAKPHAAPVEFAPGWAKDTPNIYGYGMSEADGTIPDIAFSGIQGSTIAYIWLVVSNDEVYKLGLNADDLRNLIGAAMAVYERMEADDSGEVPR